MSKKLKVFILISSDIRFKPKVLHKLLLQLGDQAIGVAEVKYASAATSATRRQKLSPREYWGTGGFIQIAIQHVGLKLLDFIPLPRFLKHRLTITNVCRFFGVPHQEVHDVNDPAFVAAVRQQAPDVLACLQRQILQQPLLETPAICCLNCHPSELPKYRGPDPIFAALDANEPVIGVSAHTMTTKIDGGRILAQVSFEAKPCYSVLDVYTLAHDFYAEVMISALAKIAENGTAGFTEVPENAPYYPAPSKQAIAAFRQRGKRMV